MYTNFQVETYNRVWGKYKKAKGYRIRYTKENGNTSTVTTNETVYKLLNLLWHNKTPVGIEHPNLDTLQVAKEGNRYFIKWEPSNHGEQQQIRVSKQAYDILNTKCPDFSDIAPSTLNNTPATSSDRWGSLDIFSDESVIKAIEEDTEELPQTDGIGVRVYLRLTRSPLRDPANQWRVYFGDKYISGPTPEDALFKLARTKDAVSNAIAKQLFSSHKADNTEKEQPSGDMVKIKK
jgi:hypothetical protein